MNAQIATPMEHEHTCQAGPDRMASATHLPAGGKWSPFTLLQQLFRSNHLAQAVSDANIVPSREPSHPSGTRFEGNSLLELNGIWLLKLAYGV